MKTLTTESVSSPGASQEDDCRFLGLPPELRNRIYRYALVEPGRIIVTPNGPGGSQPALLKTCQIIRSEAIRIFYLENSFQLQLQRLNGAAFTPFFKLLERYSRRAAGPKLGMKQYGDPDWENVLAWFKAYDRRDALLPCPADPMNPIICLLSGGKEILDAMHSVSWEKKKRALKGLYTALRGTDAKVVRGEDRVQ